MPPIWLLAQKTTNVALCDNNLPSFLMLAAVDCIVGMIVLNSTHTLAERLSLYGVVVGTSILAVVTA